MNIHREFIRCEASTKSATGESASGGGIPINGALSSATARHWNRIQARFGTINSTGMMAPDLPAGFMDLGANHIECEAVSAVETSALRIGAPVHVHPVRTRRPRTEVDSASASSGGPTQLLGGHECAGGDHVVLVAVRAEAGEIRRPEQRCPVGHRCPAGDVNVARRAAGVQDPPTS